MKLNRLAVLKEQSDIKTYSLRLCLYFIGMVLLSLGIILCVKCGLGISPISSIPYVLKFIVPLSFGTLTMLFHLINSLIQYLLEGKLINLRILLQIPVAVLLGILIDLFEELLPLDPDNLFFKCTLLIFSVFFTALGMVFMVNMDLVQNPPDGTVKLLSCRRETSMGKIKILYDIACVAISLLLALIFLRRPEGFGAATVVSAIFVGKSLSWLQKPIGTRLRSLVRS